MKRPLPVVKETPPSLGRRTVMDRALAARHGVPYVHLVAFAIDLDRVREATDAHPAATRWPFGWEVYLTAQYLLAHVDPIAARALVEDTCTSVVEAGDALGGQLPFAVYTLVSRGAYPDDLSALFSGWSAPPEELVKALSTLFDDERAGELAAACRAFPLDPPLTAPTRAALETLRD
jgi:hypothetical protein